MSASTSGTSNNASNGSKPRGRSKATSSISSSEGLPLTNSSSKGSMDSSLSMQQYLSRATDISQMDFQAALDQMRSLLGFFNVTSANPHSVFKMAFYRKQTKNHWARDDPAFCVLQLVFLALASIAYSVAFKTLSVVQIAEFMVFNVLVNWIGVGILVASLGSVLAGKYMSVHSTAGGGTSSRHVKQSIEWLYAFDIHCNAFFPFFVVAYGLQFFLLPIVLGKSFIALFVSNTLYAIAFSWYFYITHLGYRALPFLRNTEAFLFPIAAVVIIWTLNLVGYPFGLGFNASRIVAYMYFPSI
mmetsp:Transcript_3489/g.5069  ORF Transcript_3489/g.5069 Transcript_3489/m.5069 type:complete len:300 (-) Transcript_3489:84-983(-)